MFYALLVPLAACAVILYEILRRLEKFHADYRRTNRLD